MEHKATIRQVEFHRELVYTQGTEDYVKIWDYLTVWKKFQKNPNASRSFRKFQKIFKKHFKKYFKGQLKRTIAIRNRGCHAKMVLTEASLICSVYGGLEFHDQKLITRPIYEQTLLRRIDGLGHDVVDFIYHRERILIGL